MTNARKQISDALLEIVDNVKLANPEGDVTFPLITYAEITNVRLDNRHDRVEYQIDIHTNTFEEIIVLMKRVDEKMSGMGWRRTYETPDTQTRVDKDFYKKSLNYVAQVDTLYNYIVGGL